MPGCLPLGYYLPMNYQRSLLVAICLMCSIVAVDAGARMWPREFLLAQSEQLSQDEAAAKVRRDTGGRILGVQPGTQDGLTVYIVKVLLPDGRVREVTVRSK